MSTSDEEATFWRKNQKVTKVSGYPFPGIVQAVFTTSSGELRIVVEYANPKPTGLLHIFNASQLKAVPYGQ
jgi:hypothetical protein